MQRLAYVVRNQQALPVMELEINSHFIVWQSSSRKSKLQNHVKEVRGKWQIKVRLKEDLTVAGRTGTGCG